MKRTPLLATLLAGIFPTSALVFAQSPVQFAQNAQPPVVAQSTNWFNGNFNLLLLGRDSIASSKFLEYRDLPNGVVMPAFNFAGSRNGRDFALFGQNVGRSDQRYTGSATLDWIGVRFDYNQIPHHMGNNAQTIHTETAPGIWTLSSTLRAQLGAAVDAVPAASRNYPFYLNLLSPTIDSANHYTLSADRKRGDITLDLGGNLPFDLALTYNRDVKTGYRGASAGDILGVVTASVDVLEPLNEVTQDFGLRWGWNIQNKGNLHASLSRNIYNNRIDALIVDNPFRATDLAYTSTAVPGGPAQARFSTSPDNEATRGAVGALFKFPRQTRISADVAVGQWTQNDPFLPYTINSAIVTPAGAPANQLSSLQRPSLNGKIKTTSYNVTLGTRPIDPLSIRVRYRYYDYKDKTNRWVISGDTSGSPDRSWTAANAPTPDEPYGHATANRTDSSTGHFQTEVSYDIGDITLEGVYRNVQTSWEGRVGSSGTDGEENGYTVAALYHSTDWAGFRFQFDGAKRTVSGLEAGSVAAVQGVMADHAERKRTRIGADIEITPSDKYGVTLAYFRRNDDYPNRPFKVAGNSATESGLLEAKYDMFSLDLDFTPTSRAVLTGFYSYEKVAEVNQWVTLTSGALNNLLRYAPWDKGHTFGFNGVFQLVPGRWTLTLQAQHQKVDGFLDITAREAGAFYTPGRTTLIPTGQGGAADITDYDDMRQTMAVGDLGYTFGGAWTFSVGYGYDRYTFADAFSDGTTIFPQAVLFFLKANDGNYTASMGYARLAYRF
ncbi:MAG: MtrB/PioB family outer membrane beta-barrel protein [Vicinamibacterales bacterium]